jgi:lipoprotein-releasing system permease protein
MNGFERDVRNQVLGMSGHINLIFGDNGSEDWENKLRTVLSNPEVIAFSPYVRSGALISNNDVVISVSVEGVLPENEERATDIANHVDLNASLTTKKSTPLAVIGEKLAKKLNVSENQLITLITPHWDREGNFSGPEYQLLKVSGIFRTGMAQYDHKLVITHLTTAQNLFRIGHLITGVKIRLNDPMTAQEESTTINSLLPDNIRAVAWRHYNQNFFLALSSQKKLMFIILLMVVAIAASSAAINMMLLVRRNSTSIILLKTLGATKLIIVKIFLIQGFILGTLGCVLGIPLGLLIVSNAQALVSRVEHVTGFDLIVPEVYLIDHLPYLIKAADLSLIALSTICITVLAAAYPACRAGAIKFFEKTEAQ